MNAFEFVKERSLDHALQTVAAFECGLLRSEDLGFNIDDLLSIVESHALVREHGTLSRAKEYADSKYTAPEVVGRLKQAIADVEACQ